MATDKNAFSRKKIMKQITTGILENNYHTNTNKLVQIIIQSIQEVTVRMTVLFSTIILSQNKLLKMSQYIAYFQQNNYICFLRSGSRFPSHPGLCIVHIRM